MIAPSPPPLPSPAALATLTPREREVLALIGKALTDMRIALTLHRSESTVMGHVKNIHRKLGTENRAHMAITAMSYGLVGPPEDPKPSSST